MLKKAGIIVAAAAAGLLAVSPLAFAGEGHHHHGDHDGSSFVNKNAGSQGIVNVSGNSLNAPIQACNNDVPVQVLSIAQVPVKDVTGALTGAVGILGKAKADSVVKADNSRSCGDNSGSVNNKAVVK